MASSVKKKKRARVVESNLLPPEVRSMPLTAEETESLLDACTRCHKRHPMIGRLRELLASFADSAQRLAEIEARCRANSFWESDHWKKPINPYLRPIKEDQKYRKGEVLRELASLSASEISPMVNANGAAPATPKRGKPRRLMK